MKILVVGGGGREHAIIKKLRENPEVREVFALPGNGGIALEATCAPIGATEIERIRDFAVEKAVDFAVVAPDDPLVLGCVDLLEASSIPCFGPNKAAAIIEGSKVFSKELMKKYSIPTATYDVFESADEALKFVEGSETFPMVIKADGLALGKGVIIAESKDGALDAIRSIMLDRVFGESGKRIVIEEFLTGPEVSVLSFTDGKTIVPMVSSMDHKRALDGDKGLNTGGMGAIAPNPYYTEEIQKRCMEEIFLPTIRAMNAEGRTFKGCLYFGLMLTEKGPKVIEYNCRFGDPETQVVLPLLKTDLLTIMKAVREGTLSEVEVEFSSGSACCVVMASGGYPQEYEKGKEITFSDTKDAIIYHAGTRLENGKILTNGGRVLGITATADTLPEAIKKAYEAVKGVRFEGAHYRRDIGARALQKQ